MRNTLIFQMCSIFIFVSCGSSLKTTAVTKLPASELATLGRVQTLGTDVALISSASGVQFYAKGDSVLIKATAKGANYNYLEVALNDEFIKRYRVSQDTINEFKIALPKGDSIKVGVFKATEAAIGDLVILNVAAEELNTNIENKSLTIEYIGDSITCGMGADASEIPCDSGNWFDQHNAYLAYGPVTAQALNADFILNSVSGMGMYRNWNDTDEPVMPDVYGNLRLNADPSQKWNATRINPNIISICLGTNDFSDGDGTKERPAFDQKQYVANYSGFVQRLIAAHPEAKIALLTSPMINPESEKGILLLNSLKQVKAELEKTATIRIFEFKGITPPGGCGYHPDLKDHQNMAAQLLPFYEELLNL